MKNILFILTFNLVLSNPFDSLTLITSNNSDEQGLISINLIDNEYNIINQWFSDFKVMSVAYLSPDSTLYVPSKTSNEDGGFNRGGRFRKFNWNGDIIWDYILP